MAKPMLAYRPDWQLLNNDGTVCNGGTISFYQTGTTTPLTVYSSSADAIAGTNGFTSCTLNSAGRPVISNVVVEPYVTQAYKYILKDSLNNVLRTVDNITTLGQLAATSAVSSNYTVVATDRDKTIKVDSTVGNRIITLLAAATAGDGFYLRIKKMDTSANTVTVAANAAETIDGNNTIILSGSYDYVEIISDGTQWVLSTSKTIYNGLTIKGTSPRVSIDGFTIGQLIYVETTISKTDLASAASKVLVTSTGVQSFKIRDIILSANGTNFATGDRTLSITDGTTAWTIIPAATLQSLTASRWLVSTPVPAPTTTSWINTASAAGTNIVAKYAGGTSDYATGVCTIILCVEKVA